MTQATPTPDNVRQQEKYKELYENILIRNYVPLKILDSETPWYELEMEINSRDVFRAFYQNEYEAEKEFTRAFLKYYWGEIPTVCSYLFTQKPV